MNYRSLGDLSGSVTARLSHLPHDIDIVVGIPRSGMLPATLIALHRGLNLLSLDAYLAGGKPVAGQRIDGHVNGGTSRAFRKALIIDDSCNNGIEMQRVKKLVSDSMRSAIPTVYAAVYVTPGSERHLDFAFETLEYPRVFEWNILAHPILERSCMDLDGVLCRDPEPQENDDGVKYLNFLRNAAPLFLPRRVIGEVVTSRLEKYRPETVEWLKQHCVQYGRLTMLDGVTAEERRRRGLHPHFKASVYKRSQAVLFVESASAQASIIAKESGKPVFSVESREMVFPGMTAAVSALAEVAARDFNRHAMGAFRRFKSHAFSRLFMSRRQ